MGKCLFMIFCFLFAYFILQGTHLDNPAYFVQANSAAKILLAGCFFLFIKPIKVSKDELIFKQITYAFLLTFSIVMCYAWLPISIESMKTAKIVLDDFFLIWYIVFGASVILYLYLKFVA